MALFELRLTSNDVENIIMTWAQEKANLNFDSINFQCEGDSFHGVTCYKYMGNVNVPQVDTSILNYKEDN